MNFLSSVGLLPHCRTYTSCELAVLCFFASALLGAVSSKLYQEVAAIQVQTLVGKIQEGEWIQTHPQDLHEPPH